MTKFIMCITSIHVHILLSKAFVVVVPPLALDQQAANPKWKPYSRRESHQLFRLRRQFETVESIQQPLLPRYAMGDDDTTIDLEGAMAAARRNLEERKSPG